LGSSNNHQWGTNTKSKQEGGPSTNPWKCVPKDSENQKKRMQKKRKKKKRGKSAKGMRIGTKNHLF